MVRDRNIRYSRADLILLPSFYHRLLKFSFLLGAQKRLYFGQNLDQPRDPGCSLVYSRYTPPCNAACLAAKDGVLNCLNCPFGWHGTAERIPPSSSPVKQTCSQAVTFDLWCTSRLQKPPVKLKQRNYDSPSVTWPRLLCPSLVWLWLACFAHLQTEKAAGKIHVPFSKPVLFFWPCVTCADMAELMISSAK